MSDLRGMFRGMDVSASALTAQRFRMEIISKNLAYADVDSTSGGKPYRQKRVAFHAVLDDVIGARAGTRIPFVGVRTTIRTNDTPGPKVPAPAGLLPGMPGVDDDGLIEKSNVDVHQEMVHLLQASRAYEANIAAVKAFREMVSRALSIGR